MSNLKKEDPRTIRSKVMIKNAVFSLLCDNPSVSNLTVQKITTKADLNRTTFYLHYQDIQDLLNQITNEILMDLTDKVEELIQAKALSEKQKLTQLLDYIYIRRNYLLRLFTMNDFEEQLFLLLRRLIETRRQTYKEDLPTDYVTVEIKTASLVGIIMWWIRKDLHFSSDYIANQINLMYRK